MDKGSIIQVDTPSNVYLRPANRFVAEFVGSGSFIPGQVKSVAGGVGEGAVVTTDDDLEITGSACAPLRVGEKALLCVRPEAVELHRAMAGPDTSGSGHTGSIETAADVGELIEYEVRLGRWLIRTRSLSVRERFERGELVTAVLDPARCLVLAA